MVSTVERYPSWQGEKTFLATTQFISSVQYENETFPKNQLVTQFPHLQFRKLDEAIIADVVQCIPSNKSISNYGVLFYTEKSKIKVFYDSGSAPLS